MENHEPERDDRTERRRSLVRLVFGVFLMLVGGLLIADNLGFDLPIELWSYWPFVLIALGSVKLLLGPAEGREGGFWLLLAGLYAAVSIHHVAGLSWGSAWPLFLLGLGFWIAVGRVACGARRVRLEERGDVR